MWTARIIGFTHTPLMTARRSAMPSTGSDSSGVSTFLRDKIAPLILASEHYRKGHLDGTPHFYDHFFSRLLWFVGGCRHNHSSKRIFQAGIDSGRGGGQRTSPPLRRTRCRPDSFESSLHHAHCAAENRTDHGL